MDIRIDHLPAMEKLRELGVFSWPIWEKEVSEFPWTYEESETCYILEGHFLVITAGGGLVQLGAGDLVTFPAGLTCTWKITKKVRKHYRFS